MINLIFILAIIAAFCIASIQTKSHTEKHAQQYTNESFQDRYFDYATWAKKTEILAVLFGIVMVLTAFITAPYLAPVFITLLLALVMLLVYVPITWRQKSIRLKDNKLIYYYKKNKKVINLYNINHVDIDHLTFRIKLTDGTRFTLPIGFKHQSYIYAILKHYRPVNTNGESRTVTTTRNS